MSFPPNAEISGAYKPTVFVGSSQKHLEVAEAVKRRLSHDGAEVTVWHEQVFIETRSYLDILLQTFAKFDFSIFMWASDDITESKGLVSPSTRDNVVLETGLALGIMGREHVFIIMEAAVKTPSDFSGIAFATYDSSLAAQEPDRAVKPACEAVRKMVFADRSPALSGNWKCTYRMSADRSHTQVIEDVHVVSTRGGVLISCESSPIGDPYSALGRLMDGNTIVGQWQNSRDKGINHGSFMLTVDPRAHHMYGYATTLTLTGATMFNSWLLARSDNADDAEIKDRFHDAANALKSLRPQF